MPPQTQLNMRSPNSLISYIRSAVIWPPHQCTKQNKASKHTHTHTDTHTCFLSQWRVRVCVCITETSRYYWTLFTCARVHAGPDMSTPVHFSLLSLSPSLLTFTLHWLLLTIFSVLVWHLVLLSFKLDVLFGSFFHPAPPTCCSPCLHPISGLGRCLQV